MHTPRRLMLVRHGLPDYSEGKRGDEPPGPPLSETGFAQATQAANVLREFAPASLYTSPLTRAQQTADRIGQVLGLAPAVESELREWHHTEALHEVSVRTTRWLVRWLGGSETCAVVVSHASPLLALLRSALYLPHVGWHRPGKPECLELSSGDRFEVSMASVFELIFEPRCVSARCLFHPSPRVHHTIDGVPHPHLPRPVCGHGENRFLRRPNWLHLLGYRP
jgi:broad specificity phosphatase PhoE